MDSFTHLFFSRLHMSVTLCERVLCSHIMSIPTETEAHLTKLGHMLLSCSGPQKTQMQMTEQSTHRNWQRAR